MPDAACDGPPLLSHGKTRGPEGAQPQRYAICRRSPEDGDEAGTEILPYEPPPTRDIAPIDLLT